MLTELAGILEAPVGGGTPPDATRPAVTAFDALAQYGRACEALAERRYNDVREDLTFARARDPGFGLARGMLAGFDAWGKHHWPTGEAEWRAALGQPGRALEEHHNRFRSVLLKGAERPTYLAAYLIVAAHAGLLGQRDAEQDILTLFWQEFADRVPPDDASQVWGGVRPILAPEGRYFRAQVDTGSDEPLPTRGEPAVHYLRPNLRGTLRWPECSALWPFDLTRRAGYREVDGGDPPTPEFAHEALSPYLTHPEYGRSWRATRLGLAVLRYYSRCEADQEAALKSSLGRLATTLFGHLDRLGPADRELAKEAVAVLKGLRPTVLPGDPLGAARLRGALEERFDLN
ncbi:MAG: hypothetical protein JWO38_1857 [Gemmataceae bacterium]|nr:hypothetical protein [Gemmataceae bacterium]